jgi:hypothetical protein
MPLPDHTRRLAERLLEAYCRGLCRPATGPRLELGFRLDEDGAVLHEQRRLCGIPGTGRPVAFARLRFAPDSGTWTLLCGDEYAAANPRWRRYPGLGPARDLAALLRVVDADPGGRFFPQLNGASLRWCSSKGRCADCAQRTQAVLGGR